MRKNKLLKRILILTLAASLVMTDAMPAMAAEPGVGVESADDTAVSDDSALGVDGLVSSEMDDPIAEADPFLDQADTDDEFALEADPATVESEADEPKDENADEDAEDLSAPVSITDMFPSVDLSLPDGFEGMVDDDPYICGDAYGSNRYALRLGGTSDLLDFTPDARGNRANPLGCTLDGVGNIARADGDVTLSMSGTYYTLSAQTILNQLNAIRLEACREGISINGKKLTEADYVPLKWSYAIEQVARNRAMESSLTMNHATLSADSGVWNYLDTNPSHTGLSPTSENLAWNNNRDGSAITYGINQFYREKADYLKELAGQPHGVTGHYTNIINPYSTYVGVAACKMDSSPNGWTCVAMQTGYHPSYGAYAAATVDETKDNSSGRLSRELNVKDSYISSISITGSSTVPKGGTSTYGLGGNVSVSSGYGSTTNSFTIPNGSDSGVTWTSSNEEVATVTDGVVTGITGGSSTITATVGRKSATKSITVTVPIESISLSCTALDPSNASIDGRSFDIIREEVSTGTVSVSYAPADATDAKSATFSSSDTSVVTVTNAGVFTVRKPGTATITASVKTSNPNAPVLTKQFTLLISSPLQGIALDKSSCLLNWTATKAPTQQLKLSYTPADTDSDRTATYTSSDPGVATVSSTGLITAVSAGETLIKVSVPRPGTPSNPFTATCAVTVNIPIKTLTLSSDDKTLYTGDTMQLTAISNPAGVIKSSDTTWTSSAPDVASVSDTGLVTACSGGTAVITAKCYDWNGASKTASCKVKVINECAVSYVMNDGTNHESNPSSYTINVAEQLYDPTRTGYIFTGWFLNEELSGSAITQIAASTRGDITLYAGWTPIHYTLAFSANSGTVDSAVTGTMASIPCTYDNSYDLPAVAFSCTNYSFAKWTTSADGSGDRYADGATVSNLATRDGDTVTLYAQWRDLRPEGVNAYPASSDTIGVVTAYEPGTRVYLSVSTGGADILYRIGSSGEYARYTDSIELTTDLPHTTGAGYMEYTITAYARIGEYTGASRSYIYRIADDSGDMGDVTSTAALDAIRQMRGMTPGATVHVSDIPVGIWIAGVDSTVGYTGDAITFPDMEVYSGRNLLTEGEDYTVKYADNIDAGTATVTIRCRGDLKGTYKKEFLIAPLRLDAVGTGGHARLIAPDTALTYNGRMQKGTTDVMYTVRCADGTDTTVTLRPGIDYTYAYDMHSGDEAAYIGYRDIASTTASRGYEDYTVTLVGCGNYTATAAFTERIYARDAAAGLIPVSKLSVSVPDGSLLEYSDAASGTVSPCEPAPVVSYRGTLLTAGADYTLTYQNNTRPGTAILIITGCGAYTGSRVETYKIRARSMSRVKLDLSDMPEDNRDHGFVYTGAPIRWESPANSATKYYSLSYTATGGSSAEPLREGRDYDVVYENNTDTGRNRASVTFIGKGIYNGSVRRSFTIYDADLSDACQTSWTWGDGLTTVTDPDTGDTYATVRYARGGAKPTVTVTCGGRVLTPGTDYTLHYAHNRSVNIYDETAGTWSDDGKIPTLTIRGKGNYTGTLTGYFSITSGSMADVTMEAADIVCANRTGNWQTSVTLTDAGGVRLSPGRDYTREIGYTYAYDTLISLDREGNDTSLRFEGDPVDFRTEYIPAGTVIRAEVRSLGNYAIDPDEPAVKYAFFRIAGESIDRASVSAADQTYTGRAIELSKTDVTVVVNRHTLSADDYDIVPGSYVNNVAAGTAQFTIEGKGAYRGTRTVKFRILAPASPDTGMQYSGRAMGSASAGGRDVAGTATSGRRTTTGATPGTGRSATGSASATNVSSQSASCYVAAEKHDILTDSKW